MKASNEYASEVAQGKRFKFGQNWSRFLSVIDAQCISIAEQSLKEMLEVDTLRGKSFLDIGSGSGLFSLAARNLGARVHAFDYDPEAVKCTIELKRRLRSGDALWMIEEGSVLDAEYLASLGKFDIVYAWGVLHHTGSMWQALENVSLVVAPGGRLFIAIYNDQGRASHYWEKVKRAYNQLPHGFKFLILCPAFVYMWGPIMCRDLLRGKPFHTWLNYSSQRGMAAWTDVVDFVGGYPFEVAKPDEICEFYRQKGFTLAKLKTCDGHGCNEYVFVKNASTKAPVDRLYCPAL